MPKKFKRTWWISGDDSLPIKSTVMTYLTVITGSIQYHTGSAPTGSPSPPASGSSGSIGSGPTGSLPTGSAVTGSSTSSIAELPRYNVDVTYPSASRTIRVAAGGNLQAAIDSALPGDQILLPSGSTFIDNYILPDKGNSTSWITIRTDLTDSVIGTSGSRMTPSRAAAANLAKILTPLNNVPAFGTNLNAHHYRLVGLEIGASPSAGLINMLVRFGDGSDNGQTSVGVTPHHLIVDRCYIHGSSVLDLKRNVTLNCAYGAVVDSWLSYAHSDVGDAQAVLGYNGPGPFLVQNNYLESSHEVIMWGGADPANVTLCPQDATVRWNHISRPVSWKGLYQVKNLLETKNVKRYLVEGNVIENNWADAQAGFAIVMKSENQDNTAPYTTSSDITIRYNKIRNVGSVFNFSGQGSSTNTNIHAARFTVYDNFVDVVNVAPYTADGIPLQMLTDMQDVIFTHNTIYNSGNSNQAISFDGDPCPRFTFHSNVLYHGVYGIKGANQSDGITTLNAFAPGSVFEYNVIVSPGGGSPGLSSTNTFPTALPGGLPAGMDGRQAGADMAAVTSYTTGVVVPP